MTASGAACGRGAARWTIRAVAGHAATGGGVTETADYVVVGGGTAGCILAARLSEDPGTRVTLLEAGPPDRDPWIHIPAGYAKLSKSRRYDWGYATEPEPELDGRSIAWPRGKVLGGIGLGERAAVPARLAA